MTDGMLKWMTSNLRDDEEGTLFVPMDAWVDFFESKCCKDAVMSYHFSSHTHKTMSCGLQIDLRCGASVFCTSQKSFIMIGTSRILESSARYVKKIAYYVIENPFPCFQAGVHSLQCVQIALYGEFLFKSYILLTIRTQHEEVPIARGKIKGGNGQQLTVLGVCNIGEPQLAGISSGLFFTTTIMCHGETLMKYVIPVKRDAGLDLCA